MKAKNLLGNLPEQWDPIRIQSEAPIEEDPQVEREWERANTRPPPDRSLGEIFRIFGGSVKYKLPKHQTPRSDQTIVVATDGSGEDVNKTTARAGAGVFFGEGDDRNTGVRVPENLPQTNQVGELYAVFKLLETTQPQINLRVLSDSKYVINMLTKNIRSIEDTGFIGVPNRALVKATFEKLKSRSGMTEFKWIKGHQGNEMNEGADRLAGQGAQKQSPNEFIFENERKFIPEGAKISALSQKLAYNGIRERKESAKKHIRPSAARMIERIQIDVEDSTGSTPGENAIWRALRHKDFSKQTRFFMWMTTHEAYKIGRYWTETIQNDRRHGTYLDPM
ncbi:hypothetical protein ONZ45_g18981 [Pleurotus djamor]|nr:hypothetical protein ONZ45_g18981 [Pleurotus djamor]